MAMIAKLRTWKGRKPLLELPGEYLQWLAQHGYGAQFDLSISDAGVATLRPTAARDDIPAEYDEVPA